MPVVEENADILVGPQDPAKARGQHRVITLTVENAATDSSGSRYALADVPSDAILDSRTAFQVQNWGFATVSIGTYADVDALVTVAKNAGNVVSPVIQLGADHGKPLWDVLGLAADPGGFIRLYAHAVANATGAGSMKAEIHYIYR